MFFFHFTLCHEHCSVLETFFENVIFNNCLILSYKVCHHLFWDIEFGLGLDCWLAPAEGWNSESTEFLHRIHPYLNDSLSCPPGCSCCPGRRSLQRGGNSDKAKERPESSFSSERRNFPLFGGFLSVSQGSGRCIWFTVGLLPYGVPWLL